MWTSNLIKSGFNVWLLKTNTHWDTSGICNPKRPNVYISTYHRILRNKKTFLERPWDRILLDEAHVIRKQRGQISQAVCNLKSPLRWCITGTPIVNSIADLKSMYKFLGIPLNVSNKQLSAHIKQIQEQICIRRTLATLRDKIQDAPPKHFIHHVILPFDTKEEEELYYSVQEQIYEESHNGTHKNQDFIGNGRDARLKLYLRLRQLSANPQVYINAKRRELEHMGEEYNREDYKHLPTKIRAFSEQIRAENGEDGQKHKYIVFCNFRSEIQILRTSLEKMNIGGICEYHGGMNQKQRSEVLKKAKSEEITVLLLQIHAGGVGLNLQEFDRCVFMCPWWTNALMEQAIARTVRIGQQNEVKVFHYILASNTRHVRLKSQPINIDSHIHNTIFKKKILMDEYIETSFAEHAA
jgi:SNF2 family DNA or RNA helicase